MVSSTSMHWLFLAVLYAQVVVTQDQIPLLRTPLKDIPSLGFGTWNLDPSNASDVVHEALKTGYRHLDCAAIYGDEKEVGAGIKKGLKTAGIEREDIWITSKLWNDHHSPELVPKALNKTLSDLNTPYLDLYLIHWPVSSEGYRPKIDYIRTWKAMTKLLESGLVRHIGVSNFSPAQLQQLMASTPEVRPFAHQLEMHPYLEQREFWNWHKLTGIHMTAYSPLGNTNPTYTSSRKGDSASKIGPLLDNHVVRKIADATSCTPAQLVLKWGMMHGTSVIPKSAHASRIQENYGSLQCKLSHENFARLFFLPSKRFNNPSASWGVNLFDGLVDAPYSLERSGMNVMATTMVLGCRRMYAKLRTLIGMSGDL